MFKNFADQWTPLLASSRVEEGASVQVELAGERLAVFRARGEVGVLLDRCPHRGVALSLGRVTDEGHLACPFHGWQFDQRGACVAVPLSCTRAEERERFSAGALACREIGGLVWVRTSLGPSPDELLLPESLSAQGWSRWVHEEVWATHWTRAMENMLDFPHLPFVHAATIGRQIRASMRPGTVMTTRFQSTPFGGELSAELDGASMGAPLEWRKPNGMVLNLDALAGGKRLRMHTYCVPIDDARTRMIVVTARDHGHHNPLLRLFDHFNRRLLLEDRRVVESSLPREVPPPGDERSVANDGPPLAFRKFYLNELKATSPGLALLRRKPASGMANDDPHVGHLSQR